MHVVTAIALRHDRDFEQLNTKLDDMLEQLRAMVTQHHRTGETRPPNRRTTVTQPLSLDQELRAAATASSLDVLGSRAPSRDRRSSGEGCRFGLISTR
jgi:hypothetical protein